MNDRPRHAALDGPILGQDPDFLRALPMDNVVGALVALTGEVYILRERLAALEGELEARRVLPAGAVENHRGSADIEQSRQRDLAAMTNRVLAELARDRTPTSIVHPDVGKYLRTYEDLQRGEHQKEGSA
jgi:hypothetical protein